MSVSTDKQPVPSETQHSPSHEAVLIHVPVEQRFPLLGLAERYALLLLTAGICLYFSVWPPSTTFTLESDAKTAPLSGETEK